MQRVIAVILTYNRKGLLKRCLDAVYSQTRPCDGVIVIDNASCDGTQQQLLEAGYPDLEVYVLSHNIGASGGFNAGFRLAYQAGADLVWMMDDDVVPQPRALQRLLEAGELLNTKNIDQAFLISTALTESGFITNTPSLNLNLNKIGYSGWPEMVEHGMVPVRRATFVSILVPRSTLAEHGLPIASMFIWGEDAEYTLRITQKKPGFLVGASKVLHLRQENGPISILSESNPARMKYHRYFIRNKIFIARKHSWRYRQVVLEAYGNFRLVIKLLCKGKFHKAWVVAHGLVGSVFFYPGIEAADAPIETLKVSVRLLEQPSLAAKKVDESQTDLGSLAGMELSSCFTEPRDARG